MKANYDIYEIVSVLENTGHETFVRADTLEEALEKAHSTVTNTLILWAVSGRAFQITETRGGEDEPDIRKRYVITMYDVEGDREPEILANVYIRKIGCEEEYDEDDHVRGYLVKLYRWSDSVGDKVRYIYKPTDEDRTEFYFPDFDQALDMINEIRDGFEQMRERGDLAYYSTNEADEVDGSKGYILKGYRRGRVAEIMDAVICPMRS